MTWAAQRYWKGCIYSCQPTSPGFLSPDISLCQNEHHTTHFKLTSPTHQMIRPTSTKIFGPSPESVLQVCKSQRSKVRLGFNGHLRTADPNMLALLAIFFSFCRNMQKCTRAKKGVKMVIKLTNVENSCKKSSRRGQLRIQPQFLRIGCNFLGENMAIVAVKSATC